MLDMKSTVTDFNAKAPRREDAEEIENVLAALIVDAAIEVHRTLGGPGLLESLYEEALYQELKLRNVSVQTQVYRNEFKNWNFAKEALINFLF